MAGLIEVESVEYKKKHIEAIQKTIDKEEY